MSWMGAALQSMHTRANLLAARTCASVAGLLSGASARALLGPDGAALAVRLPRLRCWPLLGHGDGLAMCHAAPTAAAHAL